MSLFPSSTPALESPQREVQLRGGVERVWVGAGGEEGPSREAACQPFIITASCGSVVNGMKRCVASVRPLNLSEPQLPLQPPGSPSQETAATVWLLVKHGIPTCLPSWLNSRKRERHRSTGDVVGGPEGFFACCCEQVDGSFPLPPFPGDSQPP